MSNGLSFIIGNVKRILVIASFLLGLVSEGQAQFIERPADHDRNQLVNSYTFFSEIAPSDEVPLGLSSTADLPGKKSPFLAAALSLIIPGLGEYYVGDQIWRGVIFTVLEAGLWYGNITYTNRGDDSTAAFHEFAHQNWKPELYAEHLNEMLKVRKVDDLITDPNDFSQINAAEDTLNSLHADFFTHRLPGFGEQQYYELISKYHQFARGWADATCDSLSCSPMSFRHAVMRDNMNRQYEIAQTFVYGIFLNHALSAIDAVLLARDHNSALRVQGETRQRSLPDGTTEYQMKANVSYRF
jgi:hypothetical protein